MMAHQFFDRRRLIRFSLPLLLLLAGCERFKPEAFAAPEQPAAPTPSASATTRVPPASSASEAAELIAPLTEEQRKNGFDECNVHDPLGFGPYSSWIQLPLGKMLIP